MKLPNLNDLELHSTPKEEEKVETRKKKVEKPSSLPRSPDLGSQEEPKKKGIKRKPEDRKRETKKEEKSSSDTSLKKNGKPKIPKSQYDSDGNPILLIPDLNDVDLTMEIDRFFGTKEE